jgi:hypothetical protein
MNKNIEKFHFDQFQSSIETPFTILEHNDKPDFLVKYNNQIIGIEHTSLRNRFYAPISGCEQNICNLAVRNILQLDCPPLAVQILFTFREKPSRKIVEYTANWLSNEVYQHIDDIKNNYTFQIWPSDPTISIKLIKINWNTNSAGIKWLDYHRWQPLGFNSVSRDFEMDIQKIIDKKNVLYRKYKMKCTACWLLIVIDRLKKDGNFAYEYMDKNLVYKTNYDKVFLFDLMMMQSYSLNTINI